MSKVEYSSNNSGGHWWLSDDDWKALEEGGWAVEWFKDEADPKFMGFRTIDKEGRWLGALATSATRTGLTMREAADEWERLTGQSATDAGCPCCGPPHSFTEYDDDGKWVASGPDTHYSADW